MQGEQVERNRVAGIDIVVRLRFATEVSAAAKLTKMDVAPRRDR